MRQSKLRALWVWIASFFVLVASAHAMFINEVSGDLNSLHVDFTIPWNTPNVNETAAGTWTGGTWSLSYLVGGKNPQYNEAFGYIYLRQTWLDNWQPGAIGRDFTLGFGMPTPLDQEISLNDAYPRLPHDWNNTGLIYNLDATLFAHFNQTATEARMVFDLERFGTPVEPISQDQFRSVVDTEQFVTVPESGSTLLLCALALALMQSGSLLRKYCNS